MESPIIWLCCTSAVWLWLSLVVGVRGNHLPVDHSPVNHLSDQNQSANDVTAALQCAYSEIKDGKSRSTSADDDDNSSNKTVERCGSGQHSCYSLWQRDASNASRFVILAQGCWDSSSDCLSSQCISNKKVKALNQAKFCCCFGSMCNVNIVDDGFDHVNSGSENKSSFLTTDKPLLDPNKYKNNRMTLIMVLSAIITFSLFFLFGAIFCCRICASSIVGKKRKKSADSLNLLESQSSHLSMMFLDMNNLKLSDMIGRGRYGSVWKAKLGDESVAVKIFNWQHRQYYLNEKEIYQLPFMEHPCLPQLFGFQEKMDIDSKLEYQLVLSHAPLGCLQGYLRNQTVDWTTLCKMVLSISQGLAHLHCEVRCGDRVKLCVAHRDLSSRNILVKADGSCMICDFGFAIRISGSNYYLNGVEHRAETVSLQDVGTLRYMAPEILEGAVNLRDCESAMKQIDVYALGLVLWEVASRCSDLYQGVEVPDYKQPFESEIGAHPTFEQMQVLVTKNKARPLFPDIWKDTNPAIRSLKETIEDCWDHDAEARLTSLCVEERLTELPSLWDRHKNGNLNSCVFPFKLQSQNFSNINNQFNSFLKNGNSIYNIIGYSSQDNTTIDKLTKESNCLDNNAEAKISSAKESEKNVQQANAFICPPKLSVPLQPYQGRNPCLERNLMTEQSDDELSGLLAHGLKFQNNNAGINTGNELNDFNIFDNAPQPRENNSLPSNDVLTDGGAHDAPSYRRPAAAPIPYVQNDVSIGTIPKQPNVSKNNHALSKTVDKKTSFHFLKVPLFFLRRFGSNSH